MCWEWRNPPLLEPALATRRGARAGGAGGLVFGLEGTWWRERGKVRQVAWRRVQCSARVFNALEKGDENILISFEASRRQPGNPPRPAPLLSPRQSARSNPPGIPLLKEYQIHAEEDVIDTQYSASTQIQPPLRPHACPESQWQRLGRRTNTAMPVDPLSLQDSLLHQPVQTRTALVRTAHQLSSLHLELTHPSFKLQAAHSDRSAYSVSRADILTIRSPTTSQ